MYKWIQCLYICIFIYYVYMYVHVYVYVLFRFVELSKGCPLPFMPFGAKRGMLPAKRRALWLQSEHNTNRIPHIAQTKAYT